MNRVHTISTIVGIAVLFVFWSVPNSYAHNHDIPTPLNTKQWGFTSITDGSWSEHITVLEPIVQGGVSPNEDNMRIVAIWHYLIDETDPKFKQPFWKFGVYTGGTETNPTGAIKVAETNEYYLQRIGNALHSGDGWQRTALPNPVEWSKNTPTWIYLRDYNGHIMTTWYGDKVPQDTTDNYNPIKENKGWFVLPLEITSISNPMPSTIKQIHHYYGKAYAMYIEYTVNGITQPGISLPSPPVLDYTVDGLRFDLIWTQKPDVNGKLPTHYLGEYYVSKDGVIVEETQDLEKPEIGPFIITTNHDGTQTGTYHHIHQHNDVLGHCFTITAVWEDYGEIRGIQKCGDSISIPDPHPHPEPVPDPEPEPVLGDTTIENRITALEESIKSLEDKMNVQQTKNAAYEAALTDIGKVIDKFGLAFDYTYVQIEELKTQISSVFNN